jgi:hypothetical protein
MRLSDNGGSVRQIGPTWWLVLAISSRANPLSLAIKQPFALANPYDCMMDLICARRSEGCRRPCQLPATTSHRCPRGSFQSFHGRDEAARMRRCHPSGERSAICRWRLTGAGPIWSEPSRPSSAISPATVPTPVEQPPARPSPPVPVEVKDGWPHIRRPGRCDCESGGRACTCDRVC